MNIAKSARKLLRAENANTIDIRFPSTCLNLILNERKNENESNQSKISKGFGNAYF